MPGKCSSLAFPYIPMQNENTERYDAQEGFAMGTLFPGLNLPFFKAIRSRMNCDNRALCELMALSFAITELGLYLDTHKDDMEAFLTLQAMISLYDEGKDRYIKKYGPLTIYDMKHANNFTWTCDPWPWDYNEGMED